MQTQELAVKQIKIFGLGGQGVVTGAKVFAEAVAIHENKYAQSIPAYGHERRGAPVYADVIIDEEPIRLKSFVYEPDVVVLFDLAVIDKGVQVMAGTHADTVFIINSPHPPDDAPFKDHPTFYVDARLIALNHLKLDIPNTAMLGAMAGAGLAGIESVTAAIGNAFGRNAAVNISAAEEACHVVKH